MNAVDAALFGEMIATLDAVFDLAARAAVSRDPSAVYELRVKARAQLRVAEVLRRHLARSIRLQAADGAKIDQPAAAGAGLPGRSRLQRPTSFPGGDVSRYDSPGFAGAFPTGEMLDAGSLSNTQGSTGGMRPESGELGQAPVSADPFASAQGERPMAAQGYSSTSNDNNPMRDVVSGTVTPPAVVAGAHVAGPHHPNAESGGGR